MKLNTPHILIISAFLLLQGCEAAKSLEHLGSDFNSGTKNLTEVANSLSKGMASLDPLGTKEQFMQNKELQAALEELQKKIYKITTGKPVTVLSKQKVRFQIQSYEGDFIVNLYVDHPGQMAWGNKRFSELDNQKDLNVDYWGILDQHFKWGGFSDPQRGTGAFHKPYVTDVAPGGMVIDGGRGNQPSTIEEPLFSSRQYYDVHAWLEFRSFGEAIVSSIKGTVDEKMKNYLANHNPAISASIADLNQRFFSVGAHEVILEVIPKAKNSFGKLSLTGKWWVENENGSPTEEIGTFTFLEASNAGVYNIPLRIDSVSRFPFSIVVQE